jgi:hypothetical protein
MELNDYAFFGRFPSKRMGGDSLKYQTKENFGSYLGYNL